MMKIIGDPSETIILIIQKVNKSIVEEWEKVK